MTRGYRVRREGAGKRRTPDSAGDVKRSSPIRRKSVPTPSARLSLTTRFRIRLRATRLGSAAVS